jgi:putative inorganic carbon (HCO3(-)) transporter
VRDILVTAIVMGVLPFVFRHAWVGVLLWTWISVMNPHRLAYGFAYNAPFGMLAAGATLIALVTTRDRVQLPRSATMNALVAFIVWMCVTTVFAFYVEDSVQQLNKIIKIQLMTLVGLAVLQDKQHIQWFVWVNALSLGFFGAKGGVYTILSAGGGRVWGPGGFIGGNNEIGLAILVTIPLLYYLYLTTPRKWVRVGLAVTLLLSGISVLGTQSRGAFLAIVVMTLMLWWRAPAKFWSATVLVAAAILAASIMPEEYTQRLQTIETYQEDGSAMGRINAWETAINIANRRPFGAGFAMYTEMVNGLYAPAVAENRASDPSIVRAAHSIYFQVLGEHGWIGLGLFMTIWIFVWRDASRVRKLARNDPQWTWAYHLAGMCQVSLVGYGVGGAFLSLAYFDLPYNILICMVVTQRWLVNQMAGQAGSAQEALRGASAAVAPLTPQKSV